MGRPTYSTQLDEIIGGGSIEVAFRILITNLQWPAGEPPFASGYVHVPALGTPEIYDPEGFDSEEAVWTDVTALVSEYRWNQDAGMGIDQASFSVPAAWADHAMEEVFREMRVIRVQERYSGAGHDTGWIEAGWFLSDGWSGQWDERSHTYAVNAKDALKLAHIEILGGANGYTVFEADKVKHGSYGTHGPLTYIRDGGDAWEYGLRTGDAVHPDWADRPAPQFWIENVEGAGYPVPLAVGGNAVQAVFGEGIVRISKTWATGDVGDGGNYSAGLNFPDGVDPTQIEVTGVVYRFAHPETEDYLGVHLDSDIVGGLTVHHSSAGKVYIAGDLSAYPDGLTLLARDGTGRRWKTKGKSYNSPYTEILLVSNATVAPLTKVQYGDANLCEDVALRLFLSAGYQSEHPAEPLHVSVAPPMIDGDAVTIWLPPLQYRDTEGITVCGALENLRQGGYLPPNYIARANGAGRVVIGPVQQEEPASTCILPISAPVPPAAVQHSDLRISTRVIARGKVRQAKDLAAAATMVDVPAASGGLQRSPAAGCANAIRRPGESGSGPIYDLKWLKEPDKDFGWLEDRRYPWGWGYGADGPPKMITSDAEVSTIRDLWQDKGLLEIDLGAEERISAIELDMTNPWAGAFAASNVGLVQSRVWGSNKWYSIPNGDDGNRPTIFEAQALQVQYWDSAQGDWMTLVSRIEGARQFVDIQRVAADAFETRGEVTARNLRLVCLDPMVVEMGTHDNDWWYAILAVALTRIRVWSSPEVRGTATLGSVAPEGVVGWPFDTPAWRAVYDRLRRRTEVLAEAVPWAQTQGSVNGLATEWLKFRARDLAPLSLRAVRPEARIWDTVSVALPGETPATQYLVTGATHQVTQSSVIEDLTLTAY